MSGFRRAERSVAVVKPDHLGDFILSVPALRALYGRFGAFDFFGTPGNRFLCERHLPGDVTFHPTKMAYLSRGQGGLDADDLAELVADHSVVVFLRSDHFVGELRRHLGRRLRGITEQAGVHETALQMNAVREFTGDYDAATLMWGGTIPRWPDMVGTVGISLGAGFTSNKVPLVSWLELAGQLRKLGIGVRIVAGPQEAEEATIARSRLGLSAEEVIHGSTDLDAFEQQLAACDVVIGADSGSLHLISVTRPVVGVFTSSPWWRFAPMGPHVRVLFTELPCAPCIQYSATHYNGCVWRECAGAVTVAYMLEAITAAPAQGIRSLDPIVRLAYEPSKVAGLIPAAKLDLRLGRR